MPWQQSLPTAQLWHRHCEQELRKAKRQLSLACSLPTRKARRTLEQRKLRGGRLSAPQGPTGSESGRSRLYKTRKILRCQEEAANPCPDHMIRNCSSAGSAWRYDQRSPARSGAGGHPRCNCLQYRPSSLAGSFSLLRTAQRTCINRGSEQRSCCCLPSSPKSREATSNLSSRSESD